jgi:hypothetical protein
MDLAILHGFYNLIKCIHFIKLNNIYYNINYNKLYLLNIVKNQCVHSYN